VPDAICFHAHACIEKLLKALVARGGTFPPRTHDLAELLTLLAEDVRHDPDIVRGCTLLQQFYPNSRYPQLPMPTLDEARRAFAAAHLVRDRLRRRLA
jgi:HEPN domain-containing protein